MLNDLIRALDEVVKRMLTKEELIEIDFIFNLKELGIIDDEMEMKLLGY